MDNVVKTGMMYRAPRLQDVRVHPVLYAALFSAFIWAALIVGAVKILA